MDNMRWRKSSRSGNGGDTCVEVARVPAAGDIAARDSKRPEQAFLRFSASEWRAFLGGVKRGRYDL